MQSTIQFLKDATLWSFCLSQKRTGVTNRNQAIFYITQCITMQSLVKFNWDNCSNYVSWYLVLGAYFKVLGKHGIHVIIQSCEGFLNPSFILNLSAGVNKNEGFRVTAEHQQHLIVIWAKVLLPSPTPSSHTSETHTNRSTGFNAEQFTKCLAFLPSRKYTRLDLC